MFVILKLSKLGRLWTHGKLKTKGLTNPKNNITTQDI